MTILPDALTATVDATYEDDSDDASVAIHQQDHDVLHTALKQRGLFINVAEYIEDAGQTLGSGADNSAAIQTALDAAQRGSVVYFGPHNGSTNALYETSVPLVVPDGVTILGAGTPRGTNDGGTVIKVHSSYDLEDFRGKGVFITDSYLQGNGNPGNAVNFINLCIDGANRDVNGIVIMNQRSRTYAVTIKNIGTEANRQAWDSSAQQGLGYGIVVAANTFAGTAISASGVNNEWHQMRVGSQNSRLLVESNSGQYTDGVLRDFICLIQPDTPSDVDDISVDSGGGWVFDHIHTNGSGGRALNVNALRTTITNCDFDGWNIGDQTLFRRAAVKVAITNGSGGGNVNISNNIGRWRGDPGEQDGSARDTFVFVQSSTDNSLVTINGNNLYHQTGVGTNKFFARIDDTSTANDMKVVMNGNVVDYDVDGEILDYGGTDPEYWIMEGNSWNSSPTKPTSTDYPAGTVVRHNDAVATEAAFWQFDGTSWLDGPTL